MVVYINGPQVIVRHGDLTEKEFSYSGLNEDVHVRSREKFSSDCIPAIKAQ
jgi:hypothetical protein